MAKAKKVRKLSVVEKDWIKENWKVDSNIDQLIEKLPEVSPDEVKRFVEDNFPLANVNGDAVAKLFARDEEKGIVVMTPAASQMADARKAHQVPSIDKAVRKKGDRIFIMKPEKKAR